MNLETLAEKMMRIHLRPEEMFKMTKYTHLYSAFDERGIPTHDASGNELKKSDVKKLTKDWEKQNKLFHSSKDYE